MAVADLSVQTLQAFFDVFWRVSVFIGHAAVVGAGLLSALLKRPSTTRGRVRVMEIGHRTTLPGLTLVFFALSLGLVVNMLALFALGMLGWFTPRAVMWTAVVLAMMGLASVAMFAEPRSNDGADSRKASTRDGSGTGRANTIALELLTLLAIYVACVFSALHPPGMWDDTLYHLPLARLYVEEGRIVLSEAIRYSLFPQNMNLLMSVGLMAGGVVVAQALCTIPMFVMAVGLAGFSRQMTGSGVPGLVAAILLFALAPLAGTVGYAYVDIGLALFCWAAVYAWLLAVQGGPAGGRHTHAWVLLSGQFIGAAMGVKMTAMIMAGLLGLLLVWHLRSLPGALVARRVLWFGFGIAVAGAGWYVRSAVISGDPVHPAGAPLFGYFLWNEVDYAWQKSQVMKATTINPLNLLQVLVENDIVVWLAVLIGFAFWKHIPVAVRVLYAVFFLYFVFWFFVTQVDRYLAPVAAIGMFLSVYALWNVLGMRNRYAQWAAALVVLAGAGVLVNAEATKAQDRMQHWEQILHSQTGNRLIRQASAHIPEYGPRLLQIGFESQAFFFEGTMIGDWFGPGRYWDLMHCTKTCGTMFDSATMAKLMNKHNARMLVFGRHMDKNFDPVMYADRFDVIYEDEEGALMVLREGVN